ncbi:MAG TPA: hypothetical protein VFD52_05830 [Clostridia bacterium]|nr:hypothetical protein [Clostridia bacterium]
MTNAQAQGYAVMALRNLLREKGWHPTDIRDYCRYLDMEMHVLMDFISEEIVLKQIQKALSE